MPTEKMEKLTAMLAKQPADPFLLYAVAMEHKKVGELPQAIEFLNRVIVADVNYCYGYFQQGQVYEMMNDPESARNAYEAGIIAAKRVGEAHAQSELETALAAME